MSTVTEKISLASKRDDQPENRPARCRFCSAPLSHTFVDLGMSPLCESYLSADQLNQAEAFYPLHVYVCDQCFLVQLEQYVGADAIFSDYAYFSSFSDTWLSHAKAYVERVSKRFSLSDTSQVIEIASNDGYLLQYFADRKIPALGIEPAANVAEAAIGKGVPTLVTFFGTTTARQLVRDGTQADLVVANNVLAQVPDLRDFVAGFKIILKPRGVLTIEFPHLACLIEGNQLDTIYHEHFSYFSFSTAERILAAHGLTIFDVERLATHGGSLRLYACHDDDRTKEISQNVDALRQEENDKGFGRIDFYSCFAERCVHTKHTLLDMLIGLKRQGHSIVGYGAPGKGNTLLNYCGIREDFLDYTVDRSPHKQGKFLPGTHIPILHPDTITRTRPDYVLILPWNLKDEIMQHMSGIRNWNGQFIVPIPSPTIYP